MEITSPQSQASNLPTQVSNDDYLRFRELILERSGLYFPEKKRTDLENGLLKALAGSPIGSLNGSHNLDRYYQLLCDRSNPTGQAELERLINHLTVGETYFFRDEGQFNALVSAVLPALIARKRAAAAAIGPGIQPQLRIWSAGCATGEEAYSLAIILKELLPDFDQWHILILATDINQDSLARAREASFTDWSFREDRAKAIQSRYFSFDPATRRYTLRNDIRQMVTFAPLNLVEDEYPTLYNNTFSMDLILCRNVTIYFTEMDTRQIAHKFYETLIREGWLVVGHSEPSPLIYRAFQVRTWPNALFYQKTGHPQAWPDNREWLQSTPAPATHSENWVSLPILMDQPLLLLPGSKTDRATPLPDETVSQTQFVTEDAYSANEIKSELPLETEALPEADIYEVATALLNRGQITEAVSELQRRLNFVPDFAPAYTLLGRAYANLGQWAEAKRWCQKAIELDKLQAEAYYLLGLVYEQEAQLEPAIAMLKKAIYLEPSAPLLHLNLAALYRQTKQIKNAQRASRNAIKVLEKLAPADIIPHSGGANAKHLLVAARRILSELENQ